MVRGAVSGARIASPGRLPGVIFCWYWLLRASDLYWNLTHSSSLLSHRFSPGAFAPGSYLQRIHAVGMLVTRKSPVVTHITNSTLPIFLTHYKHDTSLQMSSLFAVDLDECHQKVDRHVIQQLVLSHAPVQIKLRSLNIVHDLEHSLNICHSAFPPCLQTNIIQYLFQNRKLYGPF